MINDFKIVVDSSADIFSIDSDIKFNTAPLKIIAGDKEFVDNKELNVNRMVAYMKNFKGKSSTACPSIDDYLSAYEGAKNILCITITATLSGSYNCACIAAKDYMQKHTDSKVYVVNSLSAGPELKLYIEKAIELYKNNTTFDILCKKIEKYKKQTSLVFSLESLTNLANNGRVSPVVAKLSGILGIRVVGKASNKGDLEPLDKARGEEKALQRLFYRMEECGYRGKKVIIDHCYNERFALNIKRYIQKYYPQANIRVDKTYGLCSFYAESGGVLIGFEN